MNTTFENWDSKFSALFLQNIFLTERYNEIYTRVTELESAFNNLQGDEMPRFATGLTQELIFPMQEAAVNAFAARMPENVYLSKQDTNSSAGDDEEALQEKPIDNAKNEEDYESS